MSSITNKICKNRKEPVTCAEHYATPLFQNLAQKGYEQFSSLDLNTSHTLSPHDLELKFQNVMFSNLNKNGQLSSTYQELPKYDNLKRPEALLALSNYVLSLTPRARKKLYIDTLKNNESIRLLTGIAFSKRLAGLHKMKANYQDTGLGFADCYKAEVSKDDLKLLKTDKNALRYSCQMSYAEQVSHDPNWRLHIKEPELRFEDLISETEDAIFIGNFLARVMDKRGFPEAITQKDIQDIIIKEKLKQGKKDNLFSTTNPKLNKNQWMAITVLADRAHYLAHVSPDPNNPTLAIRGLKNGQINRGRAETNSVVITRKALNKFLSQVAINPWNLSKESQESPSGMARTQLVSDYKYCKYPPSITSDLKLPRINYRP